MPRNLTAKQEAFADALANGHNQSDAYRLAYDTKKMSNKTIWEYASRLSKHTKVLARVDKVRSPDTYKFSISREQLLKDTYSVYTAAMAKDKPDLHAATGSLRLLADIQGYIIRKAEVLGKIEHVHETLGIMTDGELLKLVRTEDEPKALRDVTAIEGEYQESES